MRIDARMNETACFDSLSFRVGLRGPVPLFGCLLNQRHAAFAPVTAGCDLAKLVADVRDGPQRETAVAAVQRRIGQAEAEQAKPLPVVVVRRTAALTGDPVAERRTGLLG